MNTNAAISIGLAAVFVLGIVLVVILVRLFNDRDDHADTLDRQARILGTHDAQLAGIRDELEALKDWLGIDVHTADVADDWAEQEADTPSVEVGESAGQVGEQVTGEIPVQPDTEPMPITDAGVTPAVEAERSTRWEAAAKEEADQARRAKEAARVDEVLKRFDFSGRKR